MDALKLFELLLPLILIDIAQCVSYTKDKWRSSIDQDTRTVLDSMDEKLRLLDSLRYSMTRCGMSLDRMSNKVDSIETHLSRMQTLMHMKLDSMAQVVASAELKYDLMMDQVARKFEASQERLMYKVKATETHIEGLISKFQTEQTHYLTKVENMQSDFLNKLSFIGTTVEDIRLSANTIEERINSTNKDSTQQLMTIENKLATNVQVENLITRLDGLHNHLNQTDVIWSQNDSPKDEQDKGKMLESFKSELLSEAHKIGNKVSSMYNEIWKRTVVIENTLKDSILENNVTHKDLREKLRHILTDQRDCERFLDVTIDRVLTIVQMKFSELNRKLDYEASLTTSNEFIDKCQTMQSVEDLEAKISTVLEKILDTFVNRTLKIDKQTQEMLEVLKAHNTQSSRNSARAENIVMTLAKEMSQDHNNLHGAVLEMTIQTDTISSAVQDIQDALTESNLTCRTYEADPVQVNTTQNHTEVKNGLREGVIKILTDLPSDTQKRNQKNETTENEVTDETVTQIMLAFFKLLRGKMTVGEFLQEANSRKAYDSVADMIRHLKPIQSVPKDFLRELDEFDQEQGLKRLWETDPSHEEDNDDDDYDTI